jgi:hypothetical protein
LGSWRKEGGRRQVTGRHAGGCKPGLEIAEKKQPSQFFQILSSQNPKIPSSQNAEGVLFTSTKSPHHRDVNWKIFENPGASGDVI